MKKKYFLLPLITIIVVLSSCLFVFSPKVLSQECPYGCQCNGDGECLASDCEDSSCCEDCVAAPTPTPEPTPTPGGGEECDFCGPWETCPDGVTTYRVRCCCGWPGCGPCGGIAADCSEWPNPCPASTGCSRPEDCPNKSWQEACGTRPCLIEKKCEGGICVWRCVGLWPCEEPTPTPIPTPTSTPVPGCPLDLTLTVSPDPALPGQLITFQAYSAAALTWCDLDSGGGTTNLNWVGVGDNYTWTWEGTAGSGGWYTAIFSGEIAAGIRCPVQEDYQITGCPVCDGVPVFNDIPRADGSGNYNKNIQWADVAYETSYDIRRCSGATCTPVSVYSVGPNSTSTTDDNFPSHSGFTPGTRLWYEVRPIKAGCTLDCIDYWNDIPAAPTPTPTNTPTPTPAPVCPLAPGDAPSSVTATRSGSNINVQWIDNADGEKRFRIQVSVNGGGYGSDVFVGPDIESYTHTGVSSSNTYRYRIRAENYDYGSDCVTNYGYSNVVPITVTPTPTPTATPTPTPTPAVTCDVSLSPSAYNINVGERRPVTANVDVYLGGVPVLGPSKGDYINRIDFSSTTTDGTHPVVCLETCPNDTAQNIFSPGNYDYSTVIEGYNVGTGEISVLVTLINGNSCPDPTETVVTLVTVEPPDPWFQTQGGDVHAEGSISSPVPSGKYFSLDLNGYPGVISYLTSADFGLGDISSKGWLAKDSLLLDYSYDYFRDKLVSSAESWNGNAADLLSRLPAAGETRILYTDVAAHLPAMTFNTRGKLIILTDRTAVVNLGNVEVTPGSFLAVFAGENINIDNESISLVEGVYIAPDGQISTDTGSNQLFLEGIFYANRFLLRRDLGAGNINPAVVFISRPDFFIEFPNELKTSYFFEQEVAP